MVQTLSGMTNLTATLRQTARTFAITILLACSLFGFSASAAEPQLQAPPQAARQSAAAGDKQAPGEQADYAAREQQDQKLADFQGGDNVVVIGGTTLVIVLLVILIIVIL